jgi:hypothetical protein
MLVMLDVLLALELPRVVVVVVLVPDTSAMLREVVLLVA